MNWTTKIVKFVRERPNQSDSSLGRSLDNWLGNELMSIEYFGEDEEYPDRFYSRRDDNDDI